MLLWIVIWDLYSFHFTVLLNHDFNCSKSFLLFSVEKVTTGAYTFEYVIWNSNPVCATIVGGSLLFPAPLTIISAKAKFLDQFKVIINQWYIQSPPKTAEVFQRNNNLSFIFTNSVYIVTSFTNIKIISIYCNTYLKDSELEERRLLGSSL